jgi:hypothetical protein
MSFWDVYWDSGEPGAIGQFIDRFVERMFAAGRGVAIQRQRGGNVAIVHVQNEGTEFEYSTFWLLTDPSANNGTGKYKLISLSPRAMGRTKRHSNTEITDNFTPGAIEL